MKIKGFAGFLSVTKYSNLPAPSVIDDLKVNHNRKISHSYLQRATDFVGGIAQAKEAEWEYEEPKLDAGIEMLSISLDGAYVLTVDDGYRESMVGTISMYDKHGARLHTTYVAASPEYRKDEFFNRLEKEIKLKKKYYPDAKTIGVADGAKNNWPFLKKHTDTQILDFWHATEYLGEASKAVFTKKSERDERDVWLEERCHDLKHKKGAAGRILAELKEHLNKKLNKSLREKLEGTITYFENNIKEKRMSYHNLIKQNAPIGSGVTEAACKTIVKQRLGGSGMRWKDKGMKIVLCLRTLVKTKGRWDQFWEKVNDFGVPAAILPTLYRGSTPDEEEFPDQHLLPSDPIFVPPLDDSFKPKDYYLMLLDPIQFNELIAALARKHGVEPPPTVLPAGLTITIHSVI